MAATRGMLYEAGKREGAALSLLTRPSTGNNEHVTPTIEILRLCCASLHRDRLGRAGITDLGRFRPAAARPRGASSAVCDGGRATGWR